jgi:putative ABC transport system permease protein
MNNLKYALRMIRKSPGSSLVIVATLALLLGTLGLSLGIAEDSRARWMPFPDRTSLVRIWRTGDGRPGAVFPREVFVGLKENCKGLQTLGGVGGHHGMTLTGEGEPTRLTAIRVSAGALEAAGLPPLMGRLFTDEEERTAEIPPVVLSHDTWQGVFGGAEGIVGRQVVIDGVQHVVVGVMPKDASANAVFFGLNIWLPGNFESAASSEKWLEIVGRLKPGVSCSSLNAELAAIVPAMERAYAEGHGRERRSTSAEAHSVDKQFGRVDADEVFLIGMVPTFVLLIAGFNVANILLARALARRRELAVRAALGAPRRLLIYPLLTESVVLAGTGAGIGLLGAYWVSKWCAAQGVPSRFNVSVICGVLGASVLMGLLVGWLPAWRTTGNDLNGSLKSGVRGGMERHRLRGFLVMGQVAMATLLCVTAALFARSYLNKRNFDPGFDVARTIEIPISLRKDVYDTIPKRRLYADQVLARLSMVAGVESVSVSTDSPVGRSPFPGNVQLEDATAPRHRVNLTAVSPGYFEMLGIPLIKGRWLDAGDKPGMDRVAVVNRRFIDRFFPEQDPIGKRIRLPIDKMPPWVTIVGVCADRPNVGHKSDFGEEVMLSFTQTAPYWGSYSFLVRSKSAAGTLLEPIRSAAVSVDPSQPVREPRTVDARLSRAVDQDTGVTRGFIAVALFGLLLAVLGVYGVVSNSVAERTHEIGVRMALGADKRAALNLVLRTGMGLVGIGLAVGFAIALGTTFAISQMIFGISPSDPWTYTGVGGLFLLTAFVAALFPGLRATRVHPMEALRHE